ncbi:hypothetical protein [Kitasatospora purpeofusca]|nr:hypothetical protein [Kitasatospora purpeofusca]MDY0810579.1 hypothetical protein [Kitasatospora purpeofusca]
MRDPESLIALVCAVLGAVMSHFDLDEADPEAILAALRERTLNRL